MNVIAWLRTPIATLIVLCAALLAQLPHAADVFRLIVGGDGWPAVIHGYAYAIALELAVLLFVVQRRNWESYMFAGVSILVNLSYYSLHGVNLFSPQAAPAWLVSIALPAAIARYSHLLVEAPHPAKNNAQVSTAPAQANAQTAAQDANAEPAQPASTAPQPRPAPTRKRKPTKLEPAQRQAQIAEQQLTTVAQVREIFGVGERTAQQDLAAVRRQLTAQNGVNHA
jgi:hypothetical protein